MTLAYVDLDNFKWLNDKLGHSAGDEALCDLVRTIHHNIRATDLLARLGGDEFALLLPECSELDARGILERIQERFSQEMVRKKWPVTMSVGAMTFPDPVRDVDAMVRRVDELMYQANKAGKNRILHHVLHDADLERQLPVHTLLAVEPLHDCGAKTLLIRVTWAAQDNQTGWLHGCVLSHRLSAEELQLWLREQTAESCHDCY